MGILFWDNIIKESPADCYQEYGFTTISTNPCGELPLNAYGQCILLHMNIFEYVKNPFTEEAEFDFDEFSKDAYICQKVMDDLVTIEEIHIKEILYKIDRDDEPEDIKRTERELWQKILKVTEDGRRTGLGSMGWADAFAALGMKYASPESIKLAEEIQKELACASYKASIHMARDRGSFRVFNHAKEFDHIFINRILEELDDDGDTSRLYAKYGRRNIANLTIAPTGTMSIISGVSSGIEPVFELKYNRVVDIGLGKQTFTIYHPHFVTWYNKNRNLFEFGDTDIEYLTEEQFKIAKEKSPYSGSTTFEINPEDKIKLQGTVQRYIDHSVSITHNVAENFPQKNIMGLISSAYNHGCKGFTLYREGSLNSILTRVGADADKPKKNDAFKRPMIINGEAYITSIKGEKFAVIIGLVNGSPYEVFCFKPNNDTIALLKTNGISLMVVKAASKRYSLHIIDGDNTHVRENFTKDSDPDSEVICRLISISLRHGVDVNYIYEQIIKPQTDINNYAKAISRTFKKYLNENILSRKQQKCPECGESLMFVEGCVKCNSCLYSKC